MPAIARLFKLMCVLAVAFTPGVAAAKGAHAIAMHGDPRLSPGFEHFPYAEPAAPKGGRIVLGIDGSFDSLNPLIVKGEPAAGVREWVIETLMSRGLDEPFTLYGLIAETIEVPDDRSSVAFRLNPAARFSDGKPITADDVIFSMEMLRDKGRPNHRTYYKKIIRSERISDHEVRFVFDTAGDREMPLIMGLMPVLPRHKITPDEFEKTTLSPPVGSGPYVIVSVDPGRAITYRRNPDYWGRDLPVARGRFNFDEIRYEYFREASVQFEAFKTGTLDLRNEDDPQRWAEGYAIPAVTQGRIIKAEFDTGLPAAMSALAFNVRRPVFKDQRVRQALIRLFNFEWANKNLYHGLYKRTQSYFERSVLSSAGNPATERERQLLAPFKAAVRPDILDGTYRFPITDGSGHNRENAREALRLLGEAGYAVVDGVLMNQATNAPLRFEILAGSAAQERLLSGFANDLSRLGIKASVRIVDSAQYQSRIKDFDYDMIQTTWQSSLSPGNEQLFRWSSQVAKQPGSFNYCGVENSAADAMIREMLKAATPDEFLAAVRAFDRVLLSGDYVIPLFYGPRQWVAHWRQLKHPASIPLWGYNLDTWWIEGEK